MESGLLQTLLITGVIIAGFVFLGIRGGGFSFNLKEKSFALTGGKKKKKEEIEETTNSETEDLRNRLYKETHNNNVDAVITLSNEITQLQYVHIKDQNMVLVEETIKSLELKMRSHYLTLLRKKAEDLQKKIEKTLGLLSNMTLDKTIRWKALLSKEELTYISILTKERLEDLPEVDTTNFIQVLNEAKNMLVDILNIKARQLENYIDLPDFHMYKKILKETFDTIKEDLKVRVARNGFDEKNADEWKEYIDRALVYYIDIKEKQLDDWYWHRSIVKRPELYDHNLKIRDHEKKQIIDLFNDMRRKCIEISNLVNNKRQTLKELTNYDSWLTRSELNKAGKNYG